MQQNESSTAFVSAFLLLSLSCHSSADTNGFVLRDKETGERYGVFEFRDKAEIVLNGGSAQLVTVDGTNFSLVGYARGIKRTLGPFAFTNGETIATSRATYILLKGNIAEAEAVSSSADTKATTPAVEFVLREEKSGKFYGVFQFKNNADIALAEGTGQISTTNPASFSIVLYARGIRADFGIFSFTNGASVVTREFTYSLITDNIAEAKVTIEKERAELRRYEQEQIKKGLVKYGGTWLTPKQVETLRQRRAQVAEARKEEEEARRRSEQANEEGEARRRIERAEARRSHQEARQRTEADLNRQYLDYLRSTGGY